MPSGDIALTTARSAPNLKFRSQHMYFDDNGNPDAMVIEYTDSLRSNITVTMKNGVCTGFNASTGNAVTLTIANGLTQILTEIYKPGARSAATNLLRTLAVLVAPGTVAP